jgi:signal recognition particle GTPase
MMSQLENSNAKIFESDENLNHRESDSQDFYSSKNEFTQSVLRQVEQMSQYIRNIDHDLDICGNDRTLGKDLANELVSHDMLNPLSDSLKSNICNAVSEAEKKGNERRQCRQSLNSTFKHPDLPIKWDLY